MTDTIPSPRLPVISSSSSGPDATSFLQSLVSQDLDPVAVGQSVHTLLLQPQGKLLVDFYAARSDDDSGGACAKAGSARRSPTDCDGSRSA